MKKNTLKRERKIKRVEEKNESIEENSSHSRR
jgi:hypothetical protein